MIITIRNRFVAATVLCVFSIYLLDGPIARIFADSALYREEQKFVIATWLILFPMIIVAIIITILILKKHRLSRGKQAAILASISSLVGFTINDLLLKPAFGRQNVSVFLYYSKNYGFSPFHGDGGSSFPSGHMVIVAAIITVFWQYFPRWYPLYIAILLCASLLLLAGEWHFLSDLIAGTFCGNAIGLITQKLWTHAVPALDRHPIERS